MSTAFSTGLEGSRALVTGASGGIGEAVSRLLAAENSAVALHCFSQPESAARIREDLADLESAESRFPVVMADLRKEDEVAAMFESLANDRFELDHLVVNAGVWPPESVPLHEMSLERWRNTLSVNLDGAFLCCRGFLRQLEKRGAGAGSIVLIGSTAGVFGEGGHAAYSASKAALRGMMLALKNEMVRFAPLARVNLVNPGWTATPMAAETLAEPGALERATRTMPLRKVATPADVAAAVVFFLSDRLAGHLTGQELTVAGGMEGRVLHED